jgi:flagellar FliJ protein
MKQFRYNLQTVLDYKEQVLETIRGEYADRQKKVQEKKDEIAGLEKRRKETMKEFDRIKIQGAGAEAYLIYSMLIDQTDDQISQAKEELALFEKRAEEKKQEVIEATIDVNRYDQLKTRRIAEYHKAEQKEQENFVEEFVSHQPKVQAGVRT